MKTTSGAIIEAHLTILLAALAVSRLVEARTGWSVRKFVERPRRYRTSEIERADQHSRRFLADDLCLP